MAEDRSFQLAYCRFCARISDLVEDDVGWVCVRCVVAENRRLHVELAAVRTALVAAFVPSDERPGRDVPFIRIVEHACAHHDWHHKAAREFAELREQVAEDAKRREALDLAVVHFCRSYAPGTWLDGNPDHIAGGEPDDVLYNEAVRACRSGVIPRDVPHGWKPPL